jgi:hypothetical protein
MFLRSSEALWRRCSAAQTAFAEANTSRAPDRRINFRIGVHIGDVMVRLGICLARSEHSRAAVPTITAATWFPRGERPRLAVPTPWPSCPATSSLPGKRRSGLVGPASSTNRQVGFPRLIGGNVCSLAAAAELKQKKRCLVGPLRPGLGERRTSIRRRRLRSPGLKVTPSHHPLRNSFRLLANPQALTHYPPRGYSSGGLHVQEGELSACGNTCRGAFIVIAAAGCSRLHRRTATVLHRRRASPLRI